MSSNCRGKETTKFVVCLEQKPLSAGFPEEFHCAKHWYLSREPGDVPYDWTTDIREAYSFKSPEEAADYVRSGMFLSKLCDPHYAVVFSFDILEYKETITYREQLN